MSQQEFEMGKAVEKVLHERGAKIVDPIQNISEVHTKDLFHEKLRKNGFKVPFSKFVDSLSEVQQLIRAGMLKYPFIYRTVDDMQGQNLYCVHNTKELQVVHSELQKTEKQCLAAEYLDTKSGRYYWKYRPYVLGNCVDVWEVGIDTSWIVNLGYSKSFDKEDFISVNKKQNWPIRWNAEVLNIGKCLGLGIYALDLIVEPENENSFIVLDGCVGYGLTATPDLFPPNVRELRETHYQRIVDYLCSVSY